MIIRTVYGKKNYLYNYSEFIVDEASELQNIPLDFCVGSLATVMSESKVYIYNNAHQWKLFISYRRETRDDKLGSGVLGVMKLR